MSKPVDRAATHGWGSTPSQRHFISHAQALKVIDAGIKRAEAIGVPQNIAVLDPSSWLVAFVHMDNSFLGSIDISQKKAKTVVLYNGIPNNALQNRSEPGGDLWGIQETNGGTVVFGGGQPIFDPDGYFIGAVGVSGGTVEQDIDVAVHAVQSIGTTTTLSS
ncbi:uncharacterized protein Z520_00190 [Fonsecaea multimorphosa CBS 102226]|uniref:Uncharacterized protein n=1 Tax=Fonsecaea multimorphosa CBS 102226 TaxID=1442371 RepID=A0A0D2L369_9EURO|nr:uncharacterized protein Z520_00190 [Fonsecaea multimorphosa CBS 102226]KIY03499.1 hypothetical protein Z520_00190 [Fonsecaea multimorphosa CBS 102226]